MKNSFYMETVSGAIKIDIHLMVKCGEIRKDADTSGVIEWTRSDLLVYFTCKMIGDDKHLHLTYEKKGVLCDYKIKIVEVPSNLGKGSILYFRCPESKRRSKVLYLAYGELKFLNREWYKDKYDLTLYYPSQKASSPYDKHNSIYFDLKKKVDRLREELSQKHRKSHYKGRLTKDQVRLMNLEIKMLHHDTLRTRLLLGEFREKFGDNVLKHLDHLK